MLLFFLSKMDGDIATLKQAFVVRSAFLFAHSFKVSFLHFWVALTVFFLSVDYIVEYDYDAVHDDELTIQVGEIIRNVKKLEEEGWLEGELNGKRGMFPDNFVKVSFLHWLVSVVVIQQPTYYPVIFIMRWIFNWKTFQLIKIFLNVFESFFFSSW